MTLQVDKICIKTADNYPIHGRHYRADDSQAILIVASATGVPQSYYRRFSEYASQHGFDVLTFDYRGIGESAPPTLKGFDMDYRDWARQDLQAVVDYADKMGRPTALIGHSYGGHALGLLHTPNKFSAAVFFGTGAGWQGWMPRMERLRVSLMWNLIGPVITRRHGYLRWSRLGMGEDLPLGVYKQWKRWCQFPAYFFEDPDYAHLIEQFADVKVPIRALTAIDDKWAMPRSRDAFVQYYSGSPIERIDINPADMKMNNIGHMGYFRANAVALWEQELALINQKLQNEQREAG